MQSLAHYGRMSSALQMHSCLLKSEQEMICWCSSSSKKLLTPSCLNFHVVLHIPLLVCVVVPPPCVWLHIVDDRNAVLGSHTPMLTMYSEHTCKSIIPMLCMCAKLLYPFYIVVYPIVPISMLPVLTLWNRRVYILGCSVHTCMFWWTLLWTTLSLQCWQHSLECAMGTPLVLLWFDLLCPCCITLLYVLCFFCRPIPVPKLEWGLKFQEIAKETNGFSGREISKLAIAWQVCVRMLMYIHDAITWFMTVSCT